MQNRQVITPKMRAIAKRNQKAWHDKLMTVPLDDLKKVIYMTIDQRIAYFKDREQA